MCGRTARTVRRGEGLGAQPGLPTSIRDAEAALAAYDKAISLCDEFKQAHPASAHSAKVDQEKESIAKAKADFVEREYLRAMGHGQSAWRKRDAATAGECVRVALLVKPGDRAALTLEAQMKPVLVVTAVGAQPRSAVSAGPVRSAQLAAHPKESREKMRTKVRTTNGNLKADVYVDGRKVGTTRLVYKNVEKGKTYRVSVRNPRYKPGERTVTITRGGEQAVEFVLEESKLPPGFDKAFILPTSDKDQHRNPVVTRNGSEYDQKSGWPYEVWLKEPGMEFVLIPAGEFLMGSPFDEKDRGRDEGPVHKVRITRPFYMGKYEVTQSAYQALVGRNPSYFKANSNPVEKVSWQDCVALCKKLSQAVGVEVVLPTEAQWEYACRAGTRTRFSFGDELNYPRLGEYACYRSNSGGKTDAVGQKKPNPWCLYDMHGNVWEWCQDGNRGYTSSSQTDPRGPLARLRVLRGGSWGNFPGLVRSASRYGYGPTGPYSRGSGFRVLLSLRPLSP